MEEHIIIKWLSLKSTIEYIGELEALYNPDFNYTEFGTIRNMAGSNNKKRLLRLNKIAIQQMRILAGIEERKLLK